MKKNMSAILAAALACALLLGGCGGGGSAPAYDEKSAAAATMAPAEAPAAENSAYDANAGLADYGGEMYENEKGASPAGGGDGGTPADARKIIKNAYLEIEAESADSFYRNLSSFCSGLGGYEFSYNISNYDEYSVIYATLKVPPEGLDSLVSFAGEGAKIINSAMNSDDITESYYDAQIRLETKRRSLERYYELLERAQDIEEIVYIQRIIDGITEEIEALEGRLNMWSRLVDMATVELTIRQYNDPVKIQKEISWNTLTFDDMGYLISRGFASISTTIISFFQWAVIALAAASPVLVPAAAAAVILLRLRRRKKKAAAKARGDGGETSQ